MVAMEMLVDPMLVCWLPGRVREQYERANPYFRSVLKHLQTCRVAQNKSLLRRTKREMVKWHEASLRRVKIDGKGDDDVDKGSSDLSDDSGGNSDKGVCESGDPDVVAARMLEVEADEKNKPVEMIWDPNP